MRRRATGAGAWGPWDAATPLHPVDRERGTLYSFAPSLGLAPEGDAVVALVFFELRDYPREIFDSDAVILRDGTVDGPPIPVSQMARRAKRPADALGTWFPSTAPRIHRQPDGRLWLDTLQVVETPGPTAPRIPWSTSASTSPSGSPARPARGAEGAPALRD